MKARHLIENNSTVLFTIGLEVIVIIFCAETNSLTTTRDSSLVIESAANRLRRAHR